MRVAVAGGTGVAGHATVVALRGLGHDCVVLARSTGVDLVTGAGLPAALDGVEAVVDTTNIATGRTEAAREFFRTTTHNLAAAARDARVAHVVALSIVGIDRTPLGYYQGKLAQEQVLTSSHDGVTILRATQFHEFVEQFLRRIRGPVAVVPRWRTQPVAVAEVGARLAELATGQPVGLTELAGPREEIMADLVRRFLRQRGSRRPVLGPRLPGAVGTALATGGTLPDHPGPRGTLTFQDWLRHRDGPAHRT
jgi:uncharacterized protein YbjT (DUF2867 family)